MYPVASEHLQAFKKSHENQLIVIASRQIRTPNMCCLGVGRSNSILPISRRKARVILIYYASHYLFDVDLISFSILMGIFVQTLDARGEDLPKSFFMYLFYTNVVTSIILPRPTTNITFRWPTTTSCHDSKATIRLLQYI